MDNIIFKSNIFEFLEKTSNISKISFFLLREGITKVGNFIAIDKNNSDFITYLPKSKCDLVKYNEYYSDNIGRVSIKIGRFANKFISKKTIEYYGVTDSDIESFVNIFKSYFSRSLDNVRIVEGNDILKWYLDENYHTIKGKALGTLWKSCMRYQDKNKYMSLYTKNKDIKMVILLDANEKLLGRALLWDNVTSNDGNVYKVMDRIYTFYDHDVIFFKSWANNNGYIYKTEQNSSSDRYFTINNKNASIELSVKLDIWRLSYYPYLDTFKFFNYNKGILTNSNRSSYDYILIQTDGSLEKEEEFQFDDNNN